MVKVEGQSMYPFLKSGDKILAVKDWLIGLKIGDIVVAKVNDKVIIKRVTKIINNRYFLVGDNKNKSTDSRTFGLVNKKNILAKIIYKF